MNVLFRPLRIILLALIGGLICGSISYAQISRPQSDTNIPKNPKPIESVAKSTSDIKNYSPSSPRKLPARTYAANSVLANGTWHKLAVTEKTAGVQKLNYNYLKTTLGIPDPIDARNIRIYGNGGGMLPDLANGFKYDDLKENPIYIYDNNGNDILESNDYVLFYAASPNKWKYDFTNQRFYHITNVYSDTNFYFLTMDLGTGIRMDSITNLAVVPTDTYDYFNAYTYFEEDIYNLVRSGRDWFGEKFDINPTHNKTLTLYYPVGGTNVNVCTRFAGRSDENATFEVSLNGNTPFSANISLVDLDCLTCMFASPVTICGSTNSGGGSVMSLDLELKYRKDPISQSATGWLDWIEVNYQRELRALSSPVEFRVAENTGSGKIFQYNFQSGLNASQMIWNISNTVDVKIQNFSGTNFIATADSLQEYVVFNPSSSLNTPKYAGKVFNQNLHGLSNVDYLIVTDSDFLNSDDDLLGTNDLADFHRLRGLNVNVVKVKDIYNEFSGGLQDPVAIRDFIKMFYDRWQADSALTQPKYVLLFGDGGYDYKNKVTTNKDVWIPTWESIESLNQVGTFTSDDFFAGLSDTDGSVGTSDFLDIAIGRFPVQSAEIADAVVKKIMNYNTDKCTYGSWRNVITFVADDAYQGAGSQFMNASGGSDKYANYLDANHPVYNVDKIYSDAYAAVSTPSGLAHPEVNQRIKERLNEGVLIMNYVGHGGESGWAHEGIFGLTEIQSLKNFDRLALFVTATCEFGRFDDPLLQSAGEQIFLQPEGGGIGLYTTTRVTYTGSNDLVDSKFFETVLDSFNGRRPTLGEVYMLTKNKVISSQNTRNFTFLGDPAVTLAYPQMNGYVTKINSVNIDTSANTLKALAHVKIEGEVTNASGVKQTSFNGIIYPSVYDKPLSYTTVVARYTYTSQNNLLYKGKASVKNGDFSFEFVVPKDIIYANGNGKISLYFNNDNSDGAGYYDNIIVSGTDSSANSDSKGPTVEIFLNDENFVFGGLVNENPVLKANMYDENGINLSSGGIGHDITATLDGDESNAVILNKYYEADLDSFTSGTIQYGFENLADGKHSLKAKVWDTYNNSGTAYTEFIVASSASLALSHVLNYPNPFSTHTTFTIEHNRPNANLDMQIKIFTISGRLVKTLFYSALNGGSSYSCGTSATGFKTENARIAALDWDGRDEYGDPIGRGVYIYEVKVTDPNDGASANEFQKLVILK